MMLTRVIFVLILLIIVEAEAEYVRKKICKDLDGTQCAVRSVIVDPCVQNPKLCVVKINKKYAMTINMTPSFSASKLKVAIYADVQNNGTFTTTVMEPFDGCAFLFCPLQAEENRIFNIDFMLNRNAYGKFPVKLKLWNEADESKACCFTFMVKVK